MAPVQSNSSAPPGANTDPGPHPSYIQVARPYIFEHQIQAALESVGATELKEANNRLQGVSWIDTLRKALDLPVKTYAVACVAYHKFRLVHPDTSYNYVDAATASLFHACKVADTLKKSKEILCAGHNLKVSASERLAPDDPSFEAPSRTMTGIERMILEAVGFDFRNRCPQPMVVKLAKFYGVNKETGFCAWYVCNDLYRTFAPLKQTTSTMAFASLELATRIHDERSEDLESGKDYKRFGTSRECVMETMLDLLDLYTNHRSNTIIGQRHALETFIDIRIPMNQEAARKNLPRYTRPPNRTANGSRATNGTHAKTGLRKGALENPKMEPATPNGTTGKLNERGRDGTVRFMLSHDRAEQEKKIVATFFEDQVEEYEEIIERPARRGEV